MTKTDQTDTPATPALTFDLVVIGGGSGGVRGARMAAATGAKVALIEGDRMGGTCVIRGCVPKKLLSYAAHGPEELELMAGYGFDVTPAPFDWGKLIAAKDAEINRLEGIYNRLLDGAGVTVFRGWASFQDAEHIRVGDQVLRAKTTLIATGGEVQVPQIEGAEHFSTSNDAFDLATLPARIAVYGGGYIAVELAGIFSGLGADVDLIYRGEKPLRGFDEDVRTHFLAELAKKTLRLSMGKNIIKIKETPTGKLLTLDDGTQREVDFVLAATGRRPLTNGLGLQHAGVEQAADGSVKVDGFSKTSADTIYAVGDVTNRMNLTPVAINEAMAFVDTVFKGRPRGQDYSNIATAVFSNPEVCTLGLTEAEARVQFSSGEVFVSSFRAMKHVLPDHSERTFMKLIVGGPERHVVGIHVCGLYAAEMLQGFSTALKAGATKDDFDSTVGIHPTSAEELVTMREPSHTW